MPRRLSALVVDDDATIRNLVNLILLRENFTVESAADGIEAVLKLGLNEYDLIVLDLMMPELSGRNVIDYLEQERPGMFDRVVIMTAAGENEIDRMLANRSFAVVRKPFDITAFASVVRDCVERSAQNRDSANGVR